jgi:hypothetical protein
MANNGPTGGRSLYAGILDKNSSATISSAPVMYGQQEKDDKAAAGRKKALDGIS